MRVAGTLAACAHTFVCASYPLWLVVGSNAGVLPANVPVVVRALVVVCAVTAAALWLTRPFISDLATRAMWLSAICLLFTLYGPVSVLAPRAEQPAFAASYAFAAVGLSTLVIRPWQVRPRNPMPLNALAAVVFAINVYPVVTSSVRTIPIEHPGAAVASKTPPPTAAAPAPERDIYYIVLDGFGSPDVLERDYQLDVTPFAAYLESKGFYVARGSQSNYAQTFLSLASTLNLTYLDHVSAAAGEGSRDRRPLYEFIQRNALMDAARAAGYRVIGVGSDYSATERLDGADVCHCAQRGLHELEQAAIGMSPLAALPLDRWTRDAHRWKVLDSFAAIERSARLPGRKLVFAHVLAPHPPFVFGAEGEARRGGARFGFFDGDHYPGSRADYTAGYRDQARFVMRRVASLVQVLLSRPGPPPAIVLLGDHGPGSRLRWDVPGETSMRERMGIFSAYLLPGDDPAQLWPTITPVNGVRVLARRYLGLDVPVLPDRSFFSTWSRPYDFIPVPAAD